MRFLARLVHFFGEAERRKRGKTEVSSTFRGIHGGSNRVEKPPVFQESLEKGVFALKKVHKSSLASGRADADLGAGAGDGFEFVGRFGIGVGDPGLSCFQLARGGAGVDLL